MWWAYCYNNSTYFKEAPHVGKIFGKCYKTIINNKPICDFKDLKLFLKKENNLNILDKLLKDEKDCTLNPWKLTGGVNEINSRIASEYGKIGQKIWLSTFFNFPLKFLNKVDFSLNQFLNGAFWFTSKKYEPQLRVYPKPLEFSSLLVGYFLKVGSYICICISILAIFIFFKSFFRRINPVTNIKVFLLSTLKNNKSSFDTPTFLTILIFFSTTILTNIITCCENMRMFVSVWTLPLLIITIFLFNYRLTIINILKKISILSYK